MNLDDFLTVAAYQGRAFEGQPELALDKVDQIMVEAEKRHVDILCLPESFLHGYFDNEDQAKKFSIDLQSTEFVKICERFNRYSKTTLLLGLNEREADRLYNTVVVIEQGRFLGKYRKVYTYPPYHYYSVGRDFPVFEKKGIRYGLIICLDSMYREPAHITALNGARILFCPMFNRILRQSPMLHHLNRRSHFIARAFDNHCWLVCSDIIWDENDDRTCPGYSCILDSNGEIVTTAQAFSEMLLTYSIPITKLNERKNRRLFGTAELFEITKNVYDQKNKELQLHEISVT